VNNASRADNTDTNLKNIYMLIFCLIFINSYMRGDKNFRKKLDKKCIFCGESDPSVLDVHRITEGCNGGQYNFSNTVIVCSNCHRKIHHKKNIIIHGWVTSTSGRLLHCTIDGQEEYLKRP
jgi:hypothetical protein